MSKLETLTNNAHVTSPDHIEGYLLGIRGTYDGRKVPAWMNEYRHRLLPSPPYEFCIPWDAETGEVLQRIIDEVDDETLVAFARWGLEAWEEWQGIDEGTQRPDR